jgi:hypothetical protein
LRAPHPSRGSLFADSLEARNRQSADFDFPARITHSFEDSPEQPVRVLVGSAVRRGDERISGYMDFLTPVGLDVKCSTAVATPRKSGWCNDR